MVIIYPIFLYSIEPIYHMHQAQYNELHSMCFVIRSL